MPLCIQVMMVCSSCGKVQVVVHGGVWAGCGAAVLGLRGGLRPQACVALWARRAPVFRLSEPLRRSRFGFAPIYRSMCTLQEAKVQGHGQGEAPV